MRDKKKKFEMKIAKNYVQWISALVEPHLRVRMAIPSLRPDLRHSIETVLQEQPQPVPTSRSPLKEKKLTQCSFCPRNADRKVQIYCERCHRGICNEHKLILCTNCSQCFQCSWFLKWSPDLPILYWNFLIFYVSVTNASDLSGNLRIF